MFLPGEPTTTPSPGVDAGQAAKKQSATPLIWRVAIAAVVLALGFAAYGARDLIGPRGRAFVGVFCFFGLVAMFSTNLRGVNWRTIGWGVALQVVLALLVLKVPFVKEGFNAARAVVLSFISFSDRGSEFVLGNLARPAYLTVSPVKGFCFVC